jgi:hypothetical protein
MRKHLILRWIVGALVLTAMIIATKYLMTAEGSAQAGTGRPVLADVVEKGMVRITLPVDQKFLGVAWRCDGQQACEPWYLLRVMQRGEEAQSYLVWSPDLEVRYFILENRDAGYWRTEEAGITRLSVEQRLVSVSWLCRNGSPCEPRFVTRHMRRGERARGYTFTNGHRAYYIWETD